MNPIPSNDYQNLQVLPKARRVYNPVRHIEPERGILWSSVEDTLERFNWTIINSTDLFIKARHPQAGFIIQISRMGRGTVIINQDHVMLAVCDLADLEIIVDVQYTILNRAEKEQPKGFSLRKLLRRFL